MLLAVVAVSTVSCRDERNSCCTLISCADLASYFFGIVGSVCWHEIGSYRDLWPWDWG
jgi:hypothetical protein